MWKLFKFFSLILVIVAIILTTHALIFEVDPLTEISIIPVPIEYDQ